MIVINDNVYFLEYKEALYEQLLMRYIYVYKLARFFISRNILDTFEISEYFMEVFQNFLL